VRSRGFCDVGGELVLGNAEIKRLFVQDLAGHLAE
jgi:hypothetical protein